MCALPTGQAADPVRQAEQAWLQQHGAMLVDELKQAAACSCLYLIYIASARLCVVIYP